MLKHVTIERSVRYNLDLYISKELSNRLIISKIDKQSINNIPCLQLTLY